MICDNKSIERDICYATLHRCPSCSAFGKSNRRKEMNSIVTLICYFLFGTIIVVGIGVFLQLRQQSRSKKDQEKLGNSN